MLTARDAQWTFGCLQGFIEYMTMEDVGGIIQFWLIADSFNDQLHAVDKKGKPTLDAAHAKGDATGIYKRFIAQNAAEPLGVDARTRAELEKLIAPEAGPDKRSFLRSLHLAHTSLAKHFFPAYMSSDAFYQYLNGLVSAAKVADATPAKQAKGGVAPAGDAAAGDPAAPADEKASVRMLKRTPSQLGLVDGWGVYQRDEDATNPLFNDAHSHGRVSKSRVVGIGKKKNKEHEKDVAVQVARMIITDVSCPSTFFPFRFWCARRCRCNRTTYFVLWEGDDRNLSRDLCQNDIPRSGLPRDE